MLRFILRFLEVSTVLIHFELSIATSCGICISCVVHSGDRDRLESGSATITRTFQWNISAALNLPLLSLRREVSDIMFLVKIINCNIQSAKLLAEIDFKISGSTTAPGLVSFFADHIKPLLTTSQPSRSHAG